MSELPDSISPCANVRRSCNALMEDPSDEQEGGIRSVIIDTTAMDTLADKISQSILDKFQKEESDSTANRASTSTRNASSSMCLSANDNNNDSNLDGCIDNLNFASWDEENWHYTASDFHRPKMSKENAQKHKFERVALYIMVMDCINFCFWPVTDSKECSKQGCRQGKAQGSSQEKNLLEYEHLASALKALAAKDDGLPTTSESSGTNYDTYDEGKMNVTICAEDSYLLAPQNLVKMTEESFLNVILPLLPIVSDNNEDENQSKEVYMIPNAKERVRLIIEMAQALLTFHDGSATSFIATASRSADKLVHLILQNFPGFRDATVDPWKGRWLAFYKRAQILVADLWAALGTIDENQSKDDDGDNTCSSLRRTSCVGKFGIDLCNFVDMNKITTFADYRVPQLLRNLGVLRYSTSLAGQVDRGEEIDVFSMDELYIRASTVQAVDRLVDKVSDRIVGKPNISMNINSVKMDWYLWNIGEKLDRECKLEKHHRVRTIFY